MDNLFRAKVEEDGSRFLGVKIQINQVQRLTGGDINSCFRLETNKGDFFLKQNERAPSSDMFRKEMSGLQALCRSNTVSVPRPLFTGAWKETIYMVTGFIHKARPVATFWECFARDLAALHRCTYPCFGFDEDNYIGILPQSNRMHTGWPEFYVEERLYPHIRSAYEKGMIAHRHLASAESLYKKLPEIFPGEPPSLLHGDLWGGNFMIGTDGKACLYDPAVYYGNREMDLAMSRLFGGFDVKFYRFYEEAYPLEKGWQQRIGVCQLYPMLVHLHIFGGSYSGGVRDILDGF